MVPSGVIKVMASVLCSIRARNNCSLRMSASFAMVPLPSEGLHPDHQAPHEGIKEVESPQGNRANKERDDPQELQRIDSSQDGQDSSQDSENGDSYGTLVHGRTPLNNRSVEISSS